ARAELARAEGEQARRTVERRVTQLRDRLVVNYAPLVRYVVGRISARMTGPLDGEDVMSWGVMGLLDAVESYETGRGAKFETYAISKIRWSILDELRKADALPYRVRQQAQETERVKARLAQRLRRAPTEGEVAAERGVSLEEHRAFLEHYSRAQVGSLETRVETDGDVGAELQELIADRSVADPQSEAEATALQAQLAEAMAGLGERERVVITFYFYEGLTLREIGKALGLTEGRISQILRASLLKMREALVRTA
ncbi:MAG: FliA/WhiG family RNA polymerase sigma factor, partial [Actinomycetota bacterium]